MQVHGNSASSTSSYEQYRLRFAFALGVVLALIASLVTPARAADPSNRLPWEEVGTGGASAAAVGQGFNLNASDLAFILEQIQIAETHATYATASNPCAEIIGDGLAPDPNNPGGPEIPVVQIPDGPNAYLQMLGLRTIDGSCNNLLPGQERWGAADEVFPRLAPTDYREADIATTDLNGPASPNVGEATTYDSTDFVQDSQPRIASNLIVDQTNANPAALAAAGDPVPPALPGETPIPVSIENVAPDAGLSPPVNAMFVFFGQFFDHGLDITTKNGSPVYMPLLPDDPLYVPGGNNFMMMSRAITAAGDPQNLTTPYIDQQQTYGSTGSQHVFLREYMADPTSGLPIATGRMLNGEVGGLATWSSVKTQARDLLGIQLLDADALSIPVMAVDPYGNFIPGPNGYPQIVSPGAPGGLLEGDPTANAGLGVLVPGDAVATGHSFLIDIAHHAVPTATADADTTICRSDDPCISDYHPGGAKDGQYDNEMLDAHFVCGDGRCNENIGLSAVHHVFHSEHNRLVDQIKGIILTQDPVIQAEWQLDAVGPVWNGERLLQAARFATEMQYQHLAFEEFARRVQPAVNVFGAYDASINAAITVEFSQAVYRFGHSQLNEVVGRYNDSLPGAPLEPNDITLLDAFLNPPAFFDGGTAGTLTPDQAAGSVARGVTTQVAEEIDEFTTETLRNSLLGLPLDLPSINMARARDFGVPRLNNARRAFFAATGSNPALAPYTSWNHFGINLKHLESLPNFVAAYGTHPSIAGETTLAGKRAAAEALVAASQNPGDPDYADAFAFMTSTGAWANEGDWVITGVEDIDLWVGGLAEKQESFGGILGSTFNHVFETQMERLQEGDRFYYLGRTGGMNLLVQLEGNSFSELIERNTDAMNLPGDVFSVPTFFLDAGWQNSAFPAGIGNDPATPYDERALLTRLADGTIQYNGTEHANWAGGNGPDKIHSGGGIDTVRGGDGDDTIEGGGDGDTLIGGNGDDILTDIFGPDVFKGGDGNDAIQSGPGLDLIQPGRGHDFTVGGSDGTITFGAEGNDLIFGGNGADEIHGDDGDDWLEGGEQPDKVEGDSGLVILLGVDVNAPGHDVLNGNGGDDRLFAEGGDDIMIQGAGFDQFLGQFGFDWVTHYTDPLPADSDLELNALVVPPPGVNFADQFSFVEGLSGWNQDDVLRGDSPLPADLIGHELTADGIARINGLSTLLGGATSFTDGNIILGGRGNDTIEGRGGNDFIDGDAWLKVQLSAGGTLHDSMLELQADVFSRALNPGDISIVRSIVPGAPAADADTAVFSGPRADYDITFGLTETAPTTVVHARNILLVDDGTDTLVNVEFLQFTDQTIPVDNNPVNTADVTIPTWVGGTLTVSNVSTNSLRLTWSGATDDFGVVDYNVYQDGALLPVQEGVVGTSTIVTGLDPDTTYSFTVQARDAFLNESTDGPTTNGTTIPLASEFHFTTVGTAAVAPDGGALDDANVYTWTGSAYALAFNAVSDLGLDLAADIDGLSFVSTDHFFASFNTTATTVPDGVGTVQDEDVLEYNAGVWSLFFDGTAHGLTTLDALHVSGSDIYFSTVGDTVVGTVAGAPDNADVYMWDGATFSRVLDASAALPTGGALPSAANVDAMTVVATNDIYLSFTGDITVPGLGSVQDEDIIHFTGGAWSLFFDGTTNGLTSNEHDLDAIHVGAVLPPVAGEITLTADNAFEVFVNGVSVGSGSDWQLAQVIPQDLGTGDVIAVAATDAGGIAGFLAEMVWDGGSAVSDGSWRVAASAPAGWETPGFDDSGWAAASTYGTYGVAPWNTWVAGFSTSSAAQWIWTGDTLNDNQAFFRYTIGGTAPASGSITVTADNAYEVFVNGVSVGSGSDWMTAGLYPQSLSAGDVVAVHATDAGGIAGFLAELKWSGGSAVTDASWKVSTSGPSGWSDQVFDDSGWVAASTYGTYGVAPWNLWVSGFPTSTSAQWIWTGDTLNDNEAFFRYEIGGTPPPSGSITVTADNAYEVFVNGVSVGSGSDWNVAGVFPVDLATGDVVAVHATDAGGIAGFLAELKWSGGSAVTDASWKVSATLETDWETQGFNDSGWVAASPYGIYGVAPWNTWVAGFPTSTSAQWIWTTDTLNDNEAFFRYTIG